MNCIIIEDEKPAARYLETLLKKQNITPIAILNSVFEAVEWFHANPDPDLIFLDIQLGDGLSFEIFEQVKPLSAIIFTTAYNEYALKAFKLNSIDYLLKPLNEKELVQALKKFTQNNTPIHWNSEQLKSLLIQNFSTQYRERFLVKIGTQLKTYNIDEIACFYSKNKTTYLFSNKREYPIEIPINELINTLNPKQFFQISRGVIIHLPFIESITSYSGNRFQVHIKYIQETLIVSRERVAEFKIWLES